MTDPRLRAERSRSLIVSLAAPLIVTAVAVVLQIAWLADVPSTIAIHWGGAGEPDGFAPAWTNPLIAAVMGVAVPLVLWAIARVGSRDGEWGPAMRFTGAMSLGFAVFLGVLSTWTLGVQRGLEQATDAPNIFPGLLIALAAGIVAGLLGWFIQPSGEHSGGSVTADRAVTALDLRAGERAVWVRTTTMSRGGAIVMLSAIGLMVALSVLFLLTADSIAWILVAVTVLLIVAALTTLVFRVRVDGDGLTVRSAVGIPRFRVPLSEVASVETTDVHPLGQFGGWGLRLGADGRFGIVLHRGRAIQVTRTKGRTLVVTVDDAETGAALLEALADRSRA